MFAPEEIKFLSLHGLNNDNWTDDERKTHLLSLSDEEKNRLREIDEQSNCCPYCIKRKRKEFESLKIEAIITKHGMVCRYCGNKNILNVSSLPPTYYLEKMPNSIITKEQIIKISDISPSTDLDKQMLIDLLDRVSSCYLSMYEYHMGWNHFA